MVKSYIESRLGIPRTELELELADLYLRLRRLAASHGVVALRGAAGVEAEQPVPRPRPGGARTQRRHLRSV